MLQKSYVQSYVHCSHTQAHAGLLDREVLPREVDNGSASWALGLFLCHGRVGECISNEEHHIKSVTWVPDVENPRGRRRLQGQRFSGYGADARKSHVLGSEVRSSKLHPRVLEHDER